MSKDSYSAGAGFVLPRLFEKILRRNHPTTTLLAWLAVRIPVLVFLNWMPDWVLEAVNAIVAIALAYPVFSLLLRIQWVNRFFTRATLTHYYRRYREPETTLQDLA